MQKRFTTAPMQVKEMKRMNHGLTSTPAPQTMQFKVINEGFQQSLNAEL
jgi:hypothetical protein